MNRHLAQYNVAKMRGVFEDPVMDDFRGALDAINNLASRFPGFVRQIFDDEYLPWGDQSVLPNMSVWDSLESLRDFAYRSAHGNVFSKRDKWFQPLGRPHLVMWWFDDEGEGPTYEDATRRLDILNEKGPTAEGFTFGVPFGPDNTPL